MNKIKLTSIALVSIAMSACGSDEPNTGNSNYPADNMVRVTAGVANPTSRMSYTTDNLDNFGIFIENQSYSDYSYDNIRVSGSNTTGWTLRDPAVWRNAEDPVTIRAYAPYNYGISSDWELLRISVNPDQSLDSDRSDFLLYYNPSFVPGRDLNAEGKLDITFTHALSRLDIIINMATEFNTPTIPTVNPVSDLYVVNTCLNGLLVSYTDGIEIIPNPALGAPHLKPENTSFTPAASVAEHSKATYSCIVIPQTIIANAFTIQFFAAGTAYEWVCPDKMTFETGKKYTITLNVGKDVVVPGTITAEPWDDSAGVIDAETE